MVVIARAEPEAIQGAARMENGELKRDNAVAGRLFVPFLSFSIIHLSFSIRAKRALAVDIFFRMRYIFRMKE
jgi:hypothetical protein